MYTQQFSVTSQWTINLKIQKTVSVIFNQPYACQLLYVEFCQYLPLLALCQQTLFPHGYSMWLIGSLTGEKTEWVTSTIEWDVLTVPLLVWVIDKSGSTGYGIPGGEGYLLVAIYNCYQLLFSTSIAVLNIIFHLQVSPLSSGMPYHQSNGRTGSLRTKSCQIPWITSPLPWNTMSCI